MILQHITNTEDNNNPVWITEHLDNQGYAVAKLCTIRIFHTVCVHIWYDYMHMVWLFIPYAHSYYTITVTVYKKHIAIANTVL